MHLESACFDGTKITDPQSGLDHLPARQGERAFSVRALAAGFTQTCSFAAVESYLKQYHRDELMRTLVHGRHPVLFYTVERNCVDLVRSLLDHGCDVHDLDVDKMSAMAYAVMRSKQIVLSSTEMIQDSTELRPHACRHSQRCVRGVFRANQQASVEPERRPSPEAKLTLSDTSRENQFLCPVLSAQS